MKGTLLTLGFIACIYGSSIWQSNQVDGACGRLSADRLNGNTIQSKTLALCIQEKEGAEEESNQVSLDYGIGTGRISQQDIAQSVR